LISAFIVIPLLLYRYKNLLKLAALALLSLIPMIIQIILYAGSALFTGTVMTGSSFTARLTVMTVGSDVSALSIFIVAWVSVSCFAYFISYEPGNYIKPMYLGMVAIGIFFCCVAWHPQWLILLAPFMVWTTVTHKNRNRLFVLDIIFSCVFILTVWTKWIPFGERALQYGGLKRFFISSTQPYISTSLFPSKALLIYSGVMFGALILNMIVKNPWKNTNQYEIDFELGSKDKLYAYGRFLAPIAFFLAPITLWALKVLI